MLSGIPRLHDYDEYLTLIRTLRERVYSDLDRQYAALSIPVFDLDMQLWLAHYTQVERGVWEFDHWTHDGGIASDAPELVCDAV